MSWDGCMSQVLLRGTHIGSVEWSHCTRPLSVQSKTFCSSIAGREWACGDVTDTPVGYMTEPQLVPPAAGTIDGAT
jgi:hypothetical protein